MIDSKLLRIGNCLTIPGLNKFVKVSALFATHFRCRDFDGIDYEESLRVNYVPIPLTPEILEACGFVYRGNWELDNKEKKAAHDTLITFSHYGGLIPQTVWINSGSPREINLRYLHQLQNLVLDLTGSELQVNLKEKV